MGFQLVLVAEESVPPLLHEATLRKRKRPVRVKVSSATVGRHVFPVVSVSNGEAAFLPGGRIGVKFSWQKGFYIAFERHQSIVEIRCLDGSLIKRNHFFCEACGSVTGSINSHTPGSIAGREDIKLYCTNCGAAWEVQNA
ncbi:MAG: hypothetical protein Q7S84_02455 [bacterium]|nr:hypothetical protein [bacterium]